MTALARPPDAGRVLAIEGLGVHGLPSLPSRGLVVDNA